MILLALQVASAARGVDWVEPPRVVDGRIVARVQLQEPVSPDDLSLRVADRTAPVQAALVERLGTTTLLAIDASGSFRRHYGPALDLIDPLVDRLGPEDAVGLLAFGRHTRAWTPTTDPEVLRSHLAEVRADAAVQKETRLAAAMLDGLDRLVVARPAEAGGLRRLVVFTDAGEESGVFAAEDVVEAARDRRVRIDVVAFTRASDSAYAEDLDRLLQVARGSGGTVLEVHDLSVAPDALATLWAAPSGLFDLKAEACGAGGPVELMGPHGLHSDPTVLIGTLPPCSPVVPAIPSRPSPDPEATALGQAAGRATGLLCLFVTLLTFLGLLGVAVWFARRNAEPEVEPPPAPPPPVLPPPSPEPVTPPEPPPDKDDIRPFSMRLPETHLVVVAGELTRGTRWRFTGRILRVGANSEDNDVVVDLPQVSGAHARFELYPSGSVFVEDLGSSNGTWLDGRRLAPSTREEVRPGSRVALSSQLTVVLRSKTHGQGTP